MDTPEFPYVWAWSTRDAGNIHPAWKGVRVPWFGDGIDRTGQRCRVICRSTAMNSAWIQFADGFQTNTSRGGLRRARPQTPLPTGTETTHQRSTP